MNEFQAERFFGRAKTTEYSSLAFSKCDFVGCYLPVSRTPSNPNIIRNIRATDSSQMNCNISTAIIDNVTIHNLNRTGDAPLFLWGCVFRHVTLSGNISAVKINSLIGVGGELAALQPAWDKFARTWYANVDWAMDISKAKFGGGFTLEAVPGDKVLRDPSTQVLVRRTALTDPRWRELDFDGTAIDIALSWFERRSQFGTVVLVARAAAKWAKRDRSVLDMLRQHGIADPD